MKVWLILVLAVSFYIRQNQYFGWNTTPQSDAELIADGIVFLLLAMMFLAGK